MLTQLLRAQYELSNRALLLNLEGVSEEESFWQPSGGGNCINWTLGHILASRQHVLRYLGEDPVWDPTLIQRPTLGSNFMPSIPGATLSDMLWLLCRSHCRILKSLGVISMTALEARVEGVPRAQHIIRFHFDESYQVGQISLLRRMLGKERVHHVAELPTGAGKESSGDTRVIAT